MNWVTQLFTKSEWRMCKQLDTEFVSRDLITGAESEHWLNYYLYENQFGKRKIDVADSKRGDCKMSSLEADDIAFRLKMYRDTVKPWLDGRTDPDVPAYDQVPVNDFKRRLTKKK